MSDSWRQPRRILMAALGFLTVFYLLAPTLVIVPMSFTEARILSFPPQGFSLQWYERMLTDRQWSTGLVNSVQVAVLTAILATVLGTLAALGLNRGRFPGRSVLNGLVLTPLIVPVVIIAIGMFSLFVQWRISGSLVGLVVAHTALALPFVDRQRLGEPADDGPQPRAGGRKPGRGPASDVHPDHAADHPAGRPRRRDLRVRDLVGRGRRRDLPDLGPVQDAARRDVGAGPAGRRSDGRGRGHDRPARHVGLLLLVLVVRRQRPT